MTERPTLVLVHGAASSAGVWRFWRERLEAHGFAVRAPDLRGHGRAPCDDLGRVTMSDYVADVAAAVAGLRRPPVLVGWSMGGLLALMYGAVAPTLGVLALGPSTPASLLDAPASRPPAPGVFGPEAYGITDTTSLSQPTMPDLDPEEIRLALASLGSESAFARQERRCGVWFPPRGFTGSVMIGAAERDERFPPPLCRRVARFLNAPYVEFPGASHWGLVLNRRALDAAWPAIIAWLDRLR
ncbi:MAG TPA: alpha/beta hydrolase, partial [Candidatus Binatia bacterium]|nr:alpha/beta hydrolase [Candidatus Binatia bacterium]